MHNVFNSFCVLTLSHQIPVISQLETYNLLSKTVPDTMQKRAASAALFCMPLQSIG